MKWIPPFVQCFSVTLTAYHRWLFPMLLCWILPVRIQTGFRGWQRLFAPHRRGDVASRRAADAHFMMMIGFAKASPTSRRAVWNMGVALLAPIVALIHAVRMLARHGGVVRSTHGLGWRTQLVQQYLLFMQNPAWLFVVEHHDWYYRKRMYDAAMFLQASRSIPEPGLLAATTCAIWARNQDRKGQARPSDRKSNQALRLQSASVPTVPVIARLGRGSVDFQGNYGASGLPGSGLFAKPDAGYQGKGVMAWDCAGVDRYVRAGDTTRREWTGAEIVEYLRSQSVDYVLQPRWVNHPDLVDLTGDTLCSTRILTFTDPVTLEARVFPCAWMKIPRVGAIADNIHAPGGRPGMAAAVDIDSGSLGPAGTLGPAFAADLTWRGIHPDRGSPITGRVVPYWKESIEVALAAHRAFRPHGWAWGWDVAATASHPVILEGNSHPGMYEEFFCGETFGGLPEIQALIDLCLLAERTQ